MIITLDTKKRESSHSRYCSNGMLDCKIPADHLSYIHIFIQISEIRSYLFIIVFRNEYENLLKIEFKLKVIFERKL